MLKELMEQSVELNLQDPEIEEHNRAFVSWWSSGAFVLGDITESIEVNGEELLLLELLDEFIVVHN